MTEPEPMWGATVDSEAYKVLVYQDPQEGHAGRLTVEFTETGEMLVDQPVNIMFEAVFGPDVSDVAIWQGIALEAIDKHYAARGMTPPS